MYGEVFKDFINDSIFGSKNFTLIHEKPFIYRLF